MDEEDKRNKSIVDGFCSNFRRVGGDAVEEGEDFVVPFFRGEISSDNNIFIGRVVGTLGVFDIPH